jgi:divalent metal cation (Fe/Co/Zn/Cd) transporter
MNDAGFGWYKDLALIVCVFCLVVVGTSVFFESATRAQHQAVFATAVLGSAALCMLLATSKVVVVGGVLAIFAFRSGIAVLSQPTHRPLFFAVAVVTALLLYWILRSQSRATSPYGSEKSSTVLNLLAVAVGFGLAVLVVRVAAKLTG